jgi:F-type H+-transporting ATPase subunit b
VNKHTFKKAACALTLVLSLYISPARLFAAIPGVPPPPDSSQSVETAGTSSSDKSMPAAKSSAVEESQEEKNEAYRTSPAVRAFGAKLGMNPEQSATAFEVFNFVILAILLGWLLLKMLPKTFRDRNTLIQKHLVDARTATEEASARLGNVEARLAKLDEQIAAMRTQAENDSALDEQRIKAAVEDEKQKILAAAEQEIAAATLHAHRQLQKYAAELAVEQAGRKLVINAETDRLLIQNFAARLGAEDKGGQN